MGIEGHVTARLGLSRRLCLLVLLGACWLRAGCVEPAMSAEIALEPGRKSNPTTRATGASFLDLEGHRIHPFQADDAKAIVFLFVNADCPISNRYAPEVRRLH